VVESGRAVGRFDGRRIELGPGDELEVPIGASHVNPYGTGTEKLVIRVSFEPASAFILGYAETLGHMTAAGTSDKHGEVPVLAAFWLGHATRSQTFAAGVPDAIQRRALLPLGALLGRLRGYELHMPA
jgi:hypothetical protein